jgi:hypothetical protein
LVTRPVVYLRNLNHTRRIVVRTSGEPTGRLIPPGATTALAIDLAILADPSIQARLAHARVAVLDRAGWCVDLRQRRASRLAWAELVARAERAEVDRLLGRKPGTGGAPPPPRQRKRGADAWSDEQIAYLRRRWGEGASGPQIARELNRTPGAVFAQLIRQGLGKHDKGTATVGISMPAR